MSDIFKYVIDFIKDDIFLNFIPKFKQGSVEI